jgi:predicted transcriptional regulator
MRALLKSYDLSDNEIKLYTESVGKLPLTFNEIRNFMREQSEEAIQLILDNLIEKKLLQQIKPQYSDSIYHYVFMPPIAAILNGLTEFTMDTDESELKEVKQHPPLARFQDGLFQDLENISQDLIDVISNQDTASQTTEVLTEVEQNVKKFAKVILSDIIKLIAPLKTQSGIDARDINKLITSINQKISESDGIAGNMFSQFKDIVKSMESPDIPQQVEAFKTFIRRLGESIEKRVLEIPLELIGENSFSPQKIEVMEKSLYNILTDYICKDKISSEKLWHVSTYEKIKEILSILISKSTEELTIIVPNITDFIPIEKLKLDYSDDLGTTPKPQVKSSTKIKPQKPKSKRSSISKKQKQEFEVKLNMVSKKVSELKGFELSHNVAEILSMTSEINPESVVIESIQGWLNRLLIIRKHLDSNTQYLLLENIDKWKKDYTKKVKRELEEKTIEETSGENKLDKPALEKFIKKKTVNGGLHVTIISSEPHDNKIVLAIKKKPNFEYLRLLRNNIIAILGDNSYLVFGIFQKIDHNPYFEITGFYTTFKPLIESFIPVISSISSKAKPSREIQINIGFNEIIENINDYPGRKIGKRLKNLLNVAFEKDGISLNILELKLLIGKVENLYTPLSDEMKEYVIDELNRLNTDLSSVELVYPPEFRPPILEEEVQAESEEILRPEDVEIAPVDPDKINNLFEIFLEKIGELQGEEIVNQIDKFIEVVLNLQGFPQIINWKNRLKNNQEVLNESDKEKIKDDFSRWKFGILNQVQSSEESGREQSSEIYTSSKSHQSKKDGTTSIFEEEYISPGLSQTQFQSNDSSSSESINVDLSIEMKDLFEKIEVNFSDLNGIDISKKLQNIIDIILETEGYSMSLKDIKDWISKLRKIKKPLNEEIKEDFVIAFFKWKEKYSKEEQINQTLNFGPSDEEIDV